MPYYRRNLYILSATIFLAALSWNQVIPFLPLFLKQIGVTHNLLQWTAVVFAAHSLSCIIALPFWGKLGDRYGQKPMVLRAGIFLTGIYFAMSLCATPWQLLILRFLNGALTGFIPCSVALIATNTPQEHAPRSVATAQAASAAGLIIGPAVGAWLPSIFGGDYRITMQLSGLAVLISTLLVWRFVEEPNRTKISEETSLLQDFLIALRSPILASVMFTAMLGSVFGAAVTPVLALHLTAMNGAVPPWLKGAVFSLPPIAFLLSAHPWTRFGERCGFHTAIYIGLIGGAACAIGLTFARYIWQFSALFFVTALFFTAITPAIAAIICIQVKESFRGRAYGMQNSAATFGALIAPLAASRVEVAFGISSVFAFAGIVTLAGTLALPLMIRRWDSHA